MPETSAGDGIKPQPNACAVRAIDRRCGKPMHILQIFPDARSAATPSRLRVIKLS
jgi:hypothetical protein